MYSSCTQDDYTCFIPPKIIAEMPSIETNEPPPPFSQREKKTHSFGGSTNILDDHFSLFVEVFVSQRSLLFLAQVHVLLVKEHKTIKIQITLFCSYSMKLFLLPKG